MCSIIGSFDKEKFLELVKLNSYRGMFSHSLTVIQGITSTTVKNFGAFDEALLEKIPDGCYMLGHCQAPTNGLIEDRERIHPYIKGPFKLFHNGIIKPQTMEMINRRLGTKYEWDTQALAEYITKDSGDKLYISADFVNSLEDIDGSFACCLVVGVNNIYIFRNSTAPLFIDNDLNISSTGFKDAQSIMFNSIYQLILYDRTYQEVATFENKHDPFYFGV
ncbi:MAG: hypothetical protein ACREAU_00105 [Nitrosopumilaceae archaeon]